MFYAEIMGTSGDFTGLSDINSSLLSGIINLSLSSRDPVRVRYRAAADCRHSRHTAGLLRSARERVGGGRDQDTLQHYTHGPLAPCRPQALPGSACQAGAHSDSSPQGGKPPDYF